MNQYSYKPYYRRNLPHIQPPGATFFITFNLTGSIPKHIYQQYIEEKRKLEAVEQKQNIQEKKREWFRKLEETLDQADNGPVWLKNEQIAKLVAESLHYRDGKVFHLDAYCIMANHVHVVFTPLMKQPSDTAEGTQTNSLCYNSLSSLLHSLKGYTARKANIILGRSGAFWQHESYDHCIRNPDELHRIIMYVLNNPVKIGLVKEWKEWKWNYLSKTYDLYHNLLDCVFRSVPQSVRL
ncbi:hypothetical protein F4225_11370 [Candidatus Poribacteria bacterium]|nr:hypothetical protein [Candidatus Poribacteria bacterium]MYF56319.1 hypothetical protein [Candidatus Poribacteria bacterium]